MCSWLSSGFGRLFRFSIPHLKRANRTKRLSFPISAVSFLLLLSCQPQKLQKGHKHLVTPLLELDSQEHILRRSSFLTCPYLYKSRDRSACPQNAITVVTHIPLQKRVDGWLDNIWISATWGKTDFILDRKIQENQARGKGQYSPSPLLKPDCDTHGYLAHALRPKLHKLLYLLSSSPWPLVSRTVAAIKSSNRESTKLNMSKY